MKFLFAVVIALLPVLALAQNTCGPRSTITRALERWNEELFGLGVLKTPEGQSFVLEIWRSKDGATFSIIKTDVTGKSCLMIVGEDFFETIHTPTEHDG